MNPTPELAQRVAQVIASSYESYRAGFDSITRRAPERFLARDWHGVQSDSVERLDLYRRVVTLTLSHVDETLGEGARDRDTWRAVKLAYRSALDGRGDRELAETFFNSIALRLFALSGFDPDVEFARDEAARPRPGGAALLTAYRRTGTLAATFRQVLSDLPLSFPPAALERYAAAVAAEVEKIVAPDLVEVLPTLLYRNKAAYLVGRATGPEHSVPLVLCLLHGDGGIEVDAALTDEDDVSIVFSFTRSYFQADLPRPVEVVSFLKELMPKKPRAELFNAIGLDKHGKTVFYRELAGHLAGSTDRFTRAPGDPGMVMAVFTLPSYDVVFKVIRDRFAEPKTVTRQEVVDRYRLVSTHDRAGRLVDAQQFEFLAFERSRFTEGLLEELLGSCSESVEERGAELVIKHLYTERRLVPLNLYLRTASPADAAHAVVDYGQAIRDLAASNIFPGDVLVKNFGVTRHGRVVFYDYDELALLTDCRFRDVPRARHEEDELRAEPWFHVDGRDIFPEEFLTFLGLPRPLRELFVEAHGELLRADFWRAMQERHRAGEIVEVFPYPAEKRMRPG